MAVGFNAHLTAHSFIGAGFHKIYIPPAPPPLPVPHVSVDTLRGLSINAKYSKTVIGPFGFKMIAKDNDSGYVIPHVSTPNVLLALVIAFGSSKVMFGASKVLIDVDGSGKPCGCCCQPYAPMSLNQACNDPCNFPGDLVIAPNSVMVGLTFGDWVAGWVAIAADTAVSFLMSKIFELEFVNKILGKLMNKISQSLASYFSKEIARELEQIMGSSVMKQEIESMEKAIGENIAEWRTYHLVKAAVKKVLKKATKKGAGYIADMVPGVHDSLQHLGDWADSKYYPASSDSNAVDSITGNDGSNPNIHNAE
jgi:hypothetical protein